MRGDRLGQEGFFLFRPGPMDAVIGNLAFRDFIDGNGDILDRKSVV